MQRSWERLPFRRQGRITQYLDAARSAVPRARKKERRQVTWDTYRLWYQNRTALKAIVKRRGPPKVPVVVTERH